MIKAVLLDVDNTLVDFFSMKEKAVEASVRAMIDAGLQMGFEDAYKKLWDIHWETGLDSNVWLGKFLERHDKPDDVKIAVATNAYRKVKAAFFSGI